MNSSSLSYRKLPLRTTLPSIADAVISSAHLVAGTPQSVLASHCILAVVAPNDEDDLVEGPNVFQRLGVLRKVAQKAQESAANEKPSIARPAREARDALRALGDDILQGLF